MGNKQEELEAIVQQENYDIVAIMETWWDDLHNCNAAMDGYKLFRRQRRGKRYFLQPESNTRRTRTIGPDFIQREPLCKLGCSGLTDYEAIRTHQDILSYFLWAKFASKPDRITHGISTKLIESKPARRELVNFFIYLHKSLFLQGTVLYILTIPFPPNPKGKGEMMIPNEGDDAANDADDADTLSLQVPAWLLQ
ncbi:rna-directed dna polymerase from mobile element jockey-like [Limosa lapponica baueri]|uniref:Rna-directed dna polymerase from mobile element jockey-like n=1 Tax=Limosa lapponica baueri TaxID=1758121 RepID=A0A2I0UMG2_LIMLA|nr:rna-directed dna polymerase from mobile element jockey-like [Limosa lapponica baueri]